MKFKLLIALAVLSLISCQNQSTEISSMIELSSGKIQGIQEDDLKIFKGIPYAEAPLGDLRWKEPQVKSPWEGTLDCTQFGPSPMQAAPQPFFMWSEEFLIPKEPISEDCLYLNVWTTANHTDENRAVIVWINGGGFTSGSGSVPIYDGSNLAKKGVVYVSVNYRQGVFGFLAHPELTKESPNHSSGNYGLLDQQAAIKWVKENISLFGGDPSNITIAGQSAGSMSVTSQINSPIAKGLFKRVIAQSGAPMFSQAPALQKGFMKTLEQAEADGAQLMESLNASSIAQMRSLSANELLEKTNIRLFPNLDGYVFSKDPAQLIKAAENNKVDLLTGWNQDEGLRMFPVTRETYVSNIKRDFGDLADELLALYPAMSDEQLDQSSKDLSRELIFGAQNYILASEMSKQEKSVYVYRFTRDVPATGSYVGFKAFHTGEVPYALNTLHLVDRPWKASDLNLEETMATYWTNFAKTGNPNGGELPVWNSFDIQTKSIIFLDEEVKSGTLPDASRLDFFYDKVF